MADLWFGMSAYTDFRWNGHLAKTRADVPRALVNYLFDDLGIEISRADVEKWLKELAPATDRLLKALDEPAQPGSSSECILLAIPFMPYRPTDAVAISALVTGFVRLVESSSDEVRAVIAEYGRRFELIVDTVVTIGEPTPIVLCERRPWLTKRGRWLEESLVWGDANSTHLEVRVVDHAVVLDKPRVDGIGGGSGPGVAEWVRETRDAVSIYASQPDRPYLAKVRIRARPPAARRFASWLVLSMISISTVAALALPDTGDLDLVGSLFLLTVPVTLAGTIVLTRESSSVAERLQRRLRGAIAAAVFALWSITVARVLLDSDVAWAEAAWEGISWRVRAVFDPSSSHT